MSCRAASVPTAPGVIGAFSRAAQSSDSWLVVTGTHTGGCGCCTGRGQIATSRYVQNFPVYEKTSSVYASLMISHASSNRARESARLTLYALYSRGMPRATPEIRRPPDRQSSIASSSASRSGS